MGWVVWNIKRLYVVLETFDALYSVMTQIELF
jgi:hypothetical protein